MKSKRTKRKFYALAIWIFCWSTPVASLAQWSNDPTVNSAVCVETHHQYYPAIVSDGLEGAIIAWFDYRSGTSVDIYAQRFSKDGTPLWATNGLAVCIDGEFQGWPYAVSDGNNGAIIAWTDDRSGNYETYAQRIDKDGNCLWPSNGVAVSTSMWAAYYGRTLVSDGNGGAILTWQPDRYSLKCQRVDAEGNIRLGNQVGHEWYLTFEWIA